jgi:thioredoxin-like negative regulator of GroEL
MTLFRQKSANAEWADLERKFDILASKAELMDRLEKLQSGAFVYCESATQEKIFRAGPRGFELVKTMKKELQTAEQNEIDPLKYLNETILELSAVEDAQALLTQSPRAVKKEDGAVSLIESSETS